MKQDHLRSGKRQSRKHLRETAALMRTALCALFVFCALPQPGRAQVVVSPPPFLKMTTGRVTALLDTNSGRFGVRHEDGRTLLWADRHALTSHISVRIDGRDWSNYRWAILRRERSVTCLGKGTHETLPDRLRYNWTLKTREGEYRLVQDLIPVHAPPWDEVRVRIAVENGTGAPCLAGLAVQLDVNAAGDDGAPVRAGNETSELRERMYRGGDVPESWVIEASAFAPDSGGGRLRGEGVTEPDVLLVGQWASHGALGTAVYGYEGMPGRRIYDMALFAQWDEEAVAPGQGREEGTAVGFRTADEIRGPTSFGNKFIVVVNQSGYAAPYSSFYVVSDSGAVIRVKSRGGSKYWENEFDTLKVLRAGVPDTVNIDCAFYHVPDFRDSVQRYQQNIVELSSVTSFGVLQLGGGTDGALCWPVEAGSKSYILPGFMGGGGNFVWTLEKQATIKCTPNLIGIMKTGYSPKNQRFPKDSSFVFTLPVKGQTVLVQWPDYPGPSSGLYRWYDPRDRIPDGAGTLLESDAPILVLAENDRGVPITRWSEKDEIDYIPGPNLIGAEYVFVPFEKRSRMTIRYEDFLRIVAYHDSTQVRLGDSAAPVSLRRGETLDTLTGQPFVIHASRPVAVYQFPTDWWYTNPFDTLANGAMVTLLPTRLWGRTYYGYAGLLRFPFRDRLFEEDYCRLRIYALATDIDSIAINGAVVAPSAFRRVGGYAWADFERSAGPAFVTSKRPCLVILYGGIRSIIHGSKDMGITWVFGDAHIPPYK